MFSPTSRRRDGSRSRWRTLCWNKRAWPLFLEPPSANSAKVTCASAWPIRSRTCSRVRIVSRSGQKRISDTEVQESTLHALLEEEEDSSATQAQSQSPPHAGLRLARKQQGSAALDLGRAASEEIAQLLDHDRQARRLASQYGRLGTMAERPPPVQYRQQIAQGAKPGA